MFHEIVCCIKGTDMERINRTKLYRQAHHTGRTLEDELKGWTKRREEKNLKNVANVSYKTEIWCRSLFIYYNANRDFSLTGQINFVFTVKNKKPLY